MSEFNRIGIPFFISGIVIGLILAQLLGPADNSNYLDKSKVVAGKTVTVPGYYAQYSAVRRFER